MSNKNLISIILPTYNERVNLPIIVHLLHNISNKQYSNIKKVSSFLK